MGDKPAQPKDGEQINLSLMTSDGLRISVSGIAQVRPISAADPPGVPNPFFVTSHGGEYFFVPSVSTIKQIAGGGGGGQPTSKAL